ncbi:MAG TPA: hypothetical protein VIC57_04905 [Candidatus Dormibacteraeota bacterium]|jgi:hypothetical protein
MPAAESIRRVLARRGRASGLLAAIALALSACQGWATPPTGVTSTGATLHAQVSCTAQTTNNPCTVWFQYWQDGSTSVLSTSPSTANVDSQGLVDFNQTIGGLAANTLYRAQVCGYGDDVAQPGVCVGQPGGAVSAPGSQPDAGDFSATQRFRTAGPGTVATADIGRPLSAADTSQNPISRDAGLSAAYSSSNSLWLFGDTGQKNGPAFLGGTTAAAGPYTRGLAPTALQELPTPPAAPTPGRGSPALLLPTPQGLLTPDNPPVACGSAGSDSYAPAWPSGLAQVPGTSHVLIVYAQVCVAIGRDWPTERLTLVEYDPATNSFVSSRTPFVASPLQAGIPLAQRLSSPVFGADGFLYLFGGDMATARVFVARVAANASAWGSSTNYQWWGVPGGGPAQWTTDQSSVTSLISGVTPWSVHVADYASTGSHHLGMIVQTQFGTGDFQVFQASSPTGPWTAGPAGRVPDACTGGGFGCYALSGHAELSTGDRFVLSWLSPGDRDGFGHIRVGTVAW